MPHYVQAETNYELPPEGLFPGVCVDFIDEGIKPTRWGDKHKVRYVFQIAELNSKGKRFTVSAQFNESLHENASLRQFLEKWRGKAFTDEEIYQPPGFDLESVIGVPCTLIIVHNENGAGKTFANINSISRHKKQNGDPLLPDGYVRMNERKPENENENHSEAKDPDEWDDDNPIF